MTDEASLSCPLCKSLLNSSDSLLLLCHRCLSWFHSSCLGLQDEEVENRATSNSSWSCPQCVSLEDPNDSISTCLDFVACPVCIDKSFKGKKGLRIHWARAHPDQPFTSPDLPSSSVHDSLPYKLAYCKNNIPVLRRIPKGARFFAAEKLSQVIDRCVAQNSVNCWSDLLMFPYIAFRVPNKVNNRYTSSLVSCIKENLREFKLTSPPSKKHRNLSSKARLIEEKVSDGDLRDAVRILSSDLSISTNTQSALEALSAKHPPPSRPLSFPDPPTSDGHNLSISQDLVLQSILNFPCGSASGIDGFRPQHLKDLVSSSAGDSGKHLLTSIM